MEDSVTNWMNHLAEGSDSAAEYLWERYFNKIVRAANNRLGDSPRRVHDEEDVAVSVFNSLCRGAREGRFNQLKNRDELWRLLLAMTRQKAVDRIRHETRQKRGGGMVFGESVFGYIPGKENQTAGIEQFVSEDLTPEFIALIEEESTAAINDLGENVRPFIQLRLEGYEQTEIAEKLGVSLSTVERKLRMVRKRWMQRLEDSQNKSDEF
ncbi:sigma-70 family RNA polymerase sigma factor [Gimesia benthica]|uniref:Sigma-70 family RNA polymerase sigma factor n=1 Tax=Gimesia benthica TaxID=2608982 RepID=A0A6I6AHB6_9PLAN|nr:sigma-70 family RNA polymerase sigma factor [Gimesia benthica]QGQ24790.1 sigma-70 family RNA polymerase sigma factor [Gimesia benthica]